MIIANLSDDKNLMFCDLTVEQMKHKLRSHSYVQVCLGPVDLLRSVTVYEVSPSGGDTQHKTLPTEKL